MGFDKLVGERQCYFCVDLSSQPQNMSRPTHWFSSADNAAAVKTFKTTRKIVRSQPLEQKLGRGSVKKMNPANST